MSAKLPTSPTSVDRKMIHDQLFFVSLSSVVALLVALIGVFQEQLRHFFLGAKLRLFFEWSPPHISQKESKEEGSFTRRIFVRVGVENLGRSPARDATISLLGLSELKGGVVRPLPWFVPVNLVWCHGAGSRLSSIPQGTHAYFDVGFIELGGAAMQDYFAGLLGEEGFKSFVIATAVIDPISSGYKIPEGLYHLTLQVAADDAKPITEVLELSIAPEKQATLTTDFSKMRAAHLNQRNPPEMLGFTCARLLREKQPHPFVG